jgi:hypothetical protein
MASTNLPTNQSVPSNNPGYVSIADTGVTTVGQITAQLPLLDALPDKKTRKVLTSQTRRTAASVIPSILALASQNGGQVAGVAVDVTAVQESLDEVAAAERLATVVRTLLQRLDDDALQKRASAAEIATTCMMAMRAAVRTPAGKALRPNLAALTAEMKRLRKPRKAKATTTGTTAPATGTATAASTPANAKPPAETPAAATPAK